MLRNIRYPDGVIAGKPHLFDKVEIHGEREVADYYEVDNDKPSYFIVSVRDKNGRAHPVGEQGTYGLAQRFAAELHIKYGLSVVDHVSDSAKQIKLSNIDGAAIDSQARLDDLAQAVANLQSFANITNPAVGVTFFAGALEKEWAYAHWARRREILAEYVEYERLHSRWEMTQAA